ncbi:MAG TPA: WXG100 family type VII secretion target [Micromonosporaceae bacterium]|nr:WXG100 family type VII secretion target [Micromonosporaceae bacterium]
MTQFLGMNPQEVKTLSTQFSSSADQIRQLVSSLTSQLQCVSWIGADRERFLNDWTSQHVPQLNTVAMALDTASQRAMQNAIDQENVSM